MFLLLAACAAPHIVVPVQSTSELSAPLHTEEPPTPTAAVSTAAIPPSPAVPGASPSPSHTQTATASPLPTFTATYTPTTAPTFTPTPEPAVRFAVIGDYGLAGQPAADVAALVKSWEPDLILTTGDNNYPDGAWETIDENIGQYYHEFIYPYRGSYGPGASENRFFPTLGNHDYYTDEAEPYFDYFELPGNERYYDFSWGPVHFFALNSNYQDPDGVGSGSTQAAWLRERLSASTLPWKIVYMHHPPYSSGYRGPIDWIRWPFQAWGASAVLTAHEHHYERLLIQGFPYFINGLGGGARYNLGEIHPDSAVRFNTDWGAQLVNASPGQISFEFYTRSGELVDSFTLSASNPQGESLEIASESLSQ